MNAEVIPLHPTKADLDNAFQDWLAATARRVAAQREEHEAGERYQCLAMEFHHV